jgi:hypothetical protein
MNVVHTGSFKMHHSWLRKCPVLYQYCHVNFLARRTGSHSAGEVPTLFFMECTIDEDKDDELACWPVVTFSTDAGMLYHSPFLIFCFDNHAVIGGISGTLVHLEFISALGSPNHYSKGHENF